MPDLRSLVRRGRDLSLQVKAASDELKNIKAQLIASGEGEYPGTGGAKALVVFPAPSIRPDAGAVAEVKRLVTAKQFAKLFTEETVFTPVQGFREVVGAILEETKAADVIEACEKDSAPQVRFS